MFNHYTPQSDGSYQRCTRPDPIRPSPPRQSAPVPPQPPRDAPAPQPDPASPGTSGNLLHSLMPRQMDPADLLVVMLVLLLSREESEDGCSPLLTLALYFLL